MSVPTATRSPAGHDSGEAPTLGHGLMLESGGPLAPIRCTMITTVM